jgi:hypothetical protein
MANHVPPVGLCLTCNNRATCFHQMRRGFDAIYCEMFDDYVSLPEIDGMADDSKSTLSVINSGTINDLCVNCANRDTCRLPKPTGGIWHCEEYV